MEAIASRRLAEFSYLYADANREKLSNMQDWKDLETYLKRQNLVNKFAAYAENKGQKRRNILIRQSYKRLNNAITGTVINYILGDKASTLYQCQYDKNVKEALHLIEKRLTFPSNTNQAKTK